MKEFIHIQLPSSFVLTKIHQKINLFWRNGQKHQFFNVQLYNSTKNCYISYEKFEQIFSFFLQIHLLSPIFFQHTLVSILLPNISGYFYEWVNCKTNQHRITKYHHALMHQLQTEHFCSLIPMLDPSLLSRALKMDITHLSRELLSH